MARAVSRWHVTAKVRVRSSASQCEICFGSGGKDTGFSLSTSLFPVNIIPPTFHMQLYLNVALSRGRSVRYLGTFQKQQCSLGNLGVLDRKGLSTCLNYGRQKKTNRIT